MAEFAYSPMFPLATDNNEYELVTSDHVKLVEIDGPHGPNCTHPTETNNSIKEFMEYLNS